MNNGMQSTTVTGSAPATQGRVLRPRAAAKTQKKARGSSAKKTPAVSTRRRAVTATEAVADGNAAAETGPTVAAPDATATIQGGAVAGANRRRAQARPAQAQDAQAGRASAGMTRGRAMVAQPIFTFVTAPKLTDTSHAGLTKWLDLRLEYEEAIRARCKATGEDVEAVMVSVRNSFDEALLDVLCEAKWGIAKRNLTNEYLWNWITTTVGSFKNKTLPDIKALFKKELVMPTDIDDVDARVTEYFLRCNTVIRTNGLLDLFTGSEGIVKKCKVLISSLPARLHDKVKNQVDFLTPAAKSNVQDLYSVICEKALELETEDRGVRGSKRQPPSETGAGTSTPSRPQKRKGSTTNDTRPKKGRVVTTTKPSEGGKELPPTFKCWNCGGNHKVIDCDALRRSRLRWTGTDKGGNATLKRISECLPGDAKSLCVEGVLSVKYCADSGADKSCVSVMTVARYR